MYLQVYDEKVKVKSKCARTEQAVIMYVVKPRGEPLPLPLQGLTASLAQSGFRAAG